MKPICDKLDFSGWYSLRKNMFCFRLATSAKEDKNIKESVMRLTRLMVENETEEETETKKSSFIFFINLLLIRKSGSFGTKRT